jgi:MATE family multidrug resistance protein
VLRLALPLVISSLSWTVMTFTDRMFLTWYSQDALAAALPAAVVFWTVICLPWGICTYATTFVAQYHGAQRPQRIGAAVWQGIWVALIATPVVIATVPWAHWLFQWAGHTPEIERQEIEYYQVLCYGVGFMLLGEALGAFFTGRGLTRTVMFATTIAAAVNILLDYLWIFGYGGFPEWGIAGAAWATNVALVVRAGILFALFLLPRPRRDFGTWRGWRLEPALFARLFRFGAPNGVQLTLEVFGFTVFLMYMGKLGDAELAATNLAFNISSLAFMPVYGLAIAAATLVGQHLGEDRDDLAARAAWSTCWLALAYMAIISACYVAAPALLLAGHMALADPERAGYLRDTTTVLLRFVAAYNLFDALNMVFAGAIKGAGDTRFVLYATLVMAVFLCGGIWLAVDVWDWGLFASWAFVTAWIWVVGVVYLARFLQGRWRHMRVIEPSLDAGNNDRAESPSSAEVFIG